MSGVTATEVNPRECFFGDVELNGTREKMLALGVRFEDVAHDIRILTDGNFKFEDTSTTLAVFLADQTGSIEGAFTRAILCRNEINHMGCSSSTPTAKRVSAPLNSTLEVKLLECRGGTKFGYKLIAISKP